MQTQVTKKIDFTGKNLFIGLDVHKKSWSVTILVEGIEHRTFTQPPDPMALYNYLQRMFPGGSYNSAYEAGFCGYGIHRELNSLGIKNIVINKNDPTLTTFHTSFFVCSSILDKKKKRLINLTYFNLLNKHQPSSINTRKKLKSLLLFSLFH